MRACFPCQLALLDAERLLSCQAPQAFHSLGVLRVAASAAGGVAVISPAGARARCRKE